MREVVDPGLQTLFVLLRGAGINVGLEELRRIGAVFAAAPELDEDGLRQVVEAVVVKSLEQQVAFRHVYDKWLSAIDQQIAKAEALAARRAKERAQGSAWSMPPMAVAHEPSSAHRLLAPAPSREYDKEHEASFPAPAVLRSLDEFTGPIDPMPGPTSGSAPGSANGAGGAPKSTMSPAQSGAMSPQTAPPGLEVVAGAMQMQAVARPSNLDRAKVTISPGRIPRRAGAQIVRWTAFLTGLAMTVFLLWRIADIDPPPPDNPPERRDSGPESIINSSQAHDEPQREVYAPELDVFLPEGPPLNYLGYGLLACTLALGTWLYLRRGRGRWLPEVGRAQAVPGAAVVTHAAPSGTAVGALFLDARDEENLVWGVGRFASEDLGRALDMNRTVRETAAAYGRPVLHYEAARYQREVWLWVDESLDSPAARHLARDLIRTLEGSGLPVVKSTFWGIPYHLATEGDESMTVDELDARRDTAVVAVLTDGRLMQTAYRARDRGEDLRNLLRNLSFWPRVTFLAFGRDRARLASMVEPHGMRVIQPQDAAAAISDLAGSSERGGYERLVGDARVWAASCALSPRPVDDPTALTLRRMLGLEVSPWAIETLRQNADSNAGGLSWSNGSRASLLAWLLDAEHLPERCAPPPSSLLARIIAAWDRLLDERKRVQQQSAEWWPGCLPESLLRMERGLLHLWDHPDEAAADLYELFHDHRLRPIIHHHLAQLAPREGADHPHSIPLPWSLRDRRRETQVMLAEMGLGSRAGLAGRRSLPRPGRLLLAIGLCLGAFLGSSGAIVEERLTRLPHAPALRDDWPRDSEKPPFVSRTVKDGYWEIRAWTPWSEQPVEVDVPAEMDYRLSGSPTELPCVDEQDGMELRRCCPGEALNRPFQDRWSLAVMRPHPLASDLADELLCSGSVDAVYLLAEGAPYPDWSMWGHAQQDSQLLVLAESEPESLGQYPGSAVVVSLDNLAALLTVTNFGKQGERASLADRRDRLEPIAGDLAGFEVQSMGACGDEGQRCCAPPERIDLFVCNEALMCISGKCVRQPCSPGETRCEGSAVMECNAAGTEEMARPCAEGEVCQSGACVPADDTPEPAPDGIPDSAPEGTHDSAASCTPGAQRCAPDGARVNLCSPEGHWTAGEQCAPGSLCDDAACRPIAMAMIAFRAPRLPYARRLQGYRLTCTVGKEEITWPRSSPGKERMVHVRAGVPLQVHCALFAPRRGMTDQATQTHEWRLSSEGNHTLVLEDTPGLRVSYGIDIVLTSQDASKQQSR